MVCKLLSVPIFQLCFAFRCIPEMLENQICFETLEKVLTTEYRCVYCLE